MKTLELLLDAMPVGKENARSRLEFMQLLDLPDRETRLLIERLRRMGNVICSDERGYYRPANIDELRAYCCKCRKRRRSERETNRAAEKMLKIWEEQEKFDNSPLFVENGGAAR